MQKFGVWIQKQQRYTIARSLYNVLLEEEPTDWMEIEIMACKPKEKFAFYYIKQLLDSDFVKKPQMFTTGLLPAATLPIPGPSTAAPVNTSIYSTQPPSIKPSPTVYGMQQSGVRPSIYMQLFGTSSAICMQPSESTSATYIKPSRTKPTSAVNTTLGVHNQLAYTPLSGTEPTPRAYI